MAGIYIQMLSGTGRDGDVLRLAGRRFVLGRGSSCEVRVKSDFSSRKHAAISLAESGWVVKDLGSRNGTILNGKRISRADLRPLDEIQLGPKGPTVRVITMEPAPLIGEQDEDPTRAMRIDQSEVDDSRSPEPAEEEEVPIAIPLPAQSAQSAQSESPPHRTPAPPLPRDNRPSRRMPPVLAFLGLAFAASVAIGVWGPEFPYEPATAPILWCMAGLRYVAPTAIPDPGTQLWVFRGLLGLYGLVAGFLLQRPFRRIVFLVALASIHVLAALAL